MQNIDFSDLADLTTNAFMTSGTWLEITAAIQKFICIGRPGYTIPVSRTII